MARSCAPEDCEPRQVRKEATVSGPFWVPQGHRAGAGQSERREERGDRRRVHGRKLLLLSFCVRQPAERRQTWEVTIRAVLHIFRHSRESGSPAIQTRFPFSRE